MGKTEAREAANRSASSEGRSLRDSYPSPVRWGFAMQAQAVETEKVVKDT